MTVKITMGKYQDKLLHLEEKLETGLNCELVKKDTKDIWVGYEFLTGVEKNRIDIQDVKAKNVSLLRHDMRHFLNNIAAFIENNENDKALAHKRYARCNRKRAWAWYKKHQTDC